jgi:hypothetical protein
MPPLRRVKDWVDLLSSVFPIEGLVHVGAGSSSKVGPFAELDLPSVVFIEADQSTHKKLESTIHEHDARVAHLALVAEREGEVIFYGASNPSESGLIEPSSLTSIWRNLKTNSQDQRVATTLDRLLKGDTSRGGNANWIFVDCLPAVSILSGALACLEQSDVVLARAILDSTVPTLSGATRDAVDSFLTERGFRCIGAEEEHHPAMGHLIFVRDWRALTAARIGVLRADLSHRDQMNVELAASLEALQVERNDQAVLAALRQRQLEETMSERDFKSQLAADRQDLADQIAKTNHENLELANHLRNQLDEISQQRDNALQNVSQYLESIGRLNADLDAQRSLAEQRLRDLQATSAKYEVETSLAVERQILNEQLERASNDNLRLADDLRIQLDELAKERDSAARDIAQHIQIVQQLTTERDTQIDLANRRQQQLEEAIVECRVQTQLSAEQRKIADQLTTSNDEQSRELSELQAQAAQAQATIQEGINRVDALEAERSELQAKAAQAQATIQEGTNRVDALEAERSELQAKLLQAQATIQEGINRVDALEAERSELQSRQISLDKEMLKAEAQIELIKDVILREKAF